LTADSGNTVEDMEDQPAARRGRVDALLQRDKPDAALGQHRDRVDQMTQRATEAIQPPHDQRVAFAQVVKQPRELGPLVQRATRGVAEDPQTASGGQRVVLQAELLLARRDPCVAQQRPHGANRLTTPRGRASETLISDTSSERASKPSARSAAARLRIGHF
jgi:hypothetical protein